MRSSLLFLASSLLAASLAVAGCGASADDASAGDPSDATESDLKSSSYAGDWFTHRGVDGIFARLHLESGGVYAGELHDGGAWKKESGSWSLKTVSGGKRLHLVP